MCDNREMLLAAWDKFRDDIDVMERLIQDGNEEDKNGNIAALYGESVFNWEGQIEDNSLSKEDS